MGAKRLQNAAAAAGFAMVNPDDFGSETTVRPADRRVEEPPKSAEGEKTWLSWDLFRPKATA